MADNKHSSIVSQIVAGLVVTAIIYVISLIPGAFKWITEVATNFWNHLRGTSGFPNWSLYLLALLSIHTLVYWTARIIKPSGPNIAAYNHDSFLGLKWRWSYISGHLANVWAYCPHCDTMLVYSEVVSPYDLNQETVLACETCARDLLHHAGDKNALVQKIHRQIDKKIRTGEWEQVVETKT